MKIVIVTGAAGFIGSHIANHLAENGYIVYGIDNLATGKRERLSPLVNFRNIDVIDRHGLEKFFKKVATSASPEKIYGVLHLAAMPRVQYSIDNPEMSHEVNVNGTKNVFLAAKNWDARRIIYSASSSAYGEQKILPFKEDMKADPQSPYAVQKYFGELQAGAYYKCYGLPSLCLRYFNVYGPGADPEGSYPQAVIRFVYQKSKGLPLTVTGSGENTRDSVNVRDVVRANVLALEKEGIECNGMSINIGTGRNISVLEMAKMVGGEITHIPARLEPKDTRADISLAKHVLDWEPQVSFEEGLAELKALYGVQ